MKMSTRSVVPLALPFFFVLSLTVHGAHPLITEDTGTQGIGHFQLELTHDLSRQKDTGLETRDQTLNAILSAGLSDSLDLIVGLPYERVTEWDGGAKTSAHGFADMEVAAKWRFYEAGPLSLALRPGLGLPTGNDDKGLSSAHFVPSLFGVMTYASDPWAFHLHLGYTRNLHDGSDQRNHIYHASMACELGVSDSARLVADASMESSSDLTGPTVASSVVLGLIYSVTSKLELDLGYREGLTDAAPDHAWLTGLSLHF